MERQLGFFAAVRAIEPKDPNVRESAKPRLSRQSREVLGQLRIGPASNRTLARIAMRFGGRIWDLRKAGCVINVESQNHETGEVWYRLAYEPAGL